MITHQFDIGDTVWAVLFSRGRLQSPCVPCHGKGHIVVDDARFHCTSCSGSGHRWSDAPAEKARIRRLTIGQVRMEWTADEHETRYMCNETGIGSGTVYNEDRLFATYEGEAELVGAEA